MKFGMEVSKLAIWNDNVLTTASFLIKFTKIFMQLLSL